MKLEKMELRHLRYFVAVAEKLSFTKAAAALRLAQPSLTRQIRNLEDEIGVALFDRVHNRIVMTEEGRKFLGDARSILALCADSVAGVQRMKSGVRELLNIGYVANIYQRLLPGALETFRMRYPKVGLNLFGMSSADQLRALQAGEIDLGFIGFTPATAPDLTVECLSYDSMVAALPTLHPLSKTPGGTRQPRGPFLHRDVQSHAPGRAGMAAR